MIGFSGSFNITDITRVESAASSAKGSHGLVFHSIVAIGGAIAEDIIDNDCTPPNAVALTCCGTCLAIYTINAVDPNAEKNPPTIRGTRTVIPLYIIDNTMKSVHRS